MKWLTTVLVAAIAAAVTSGCFLDNDVKDASCTPDDPSIDLNDDCAYQDSLGPQINNPDCTFLEDTPVNAGVTWEDAFGVLTDDAKGQCSLPACHGDESTAANAIFLPKNDPDRFWQTLINTEGSVRKKYVDPDNYTKSWIHCNVFGRPGGGLIMPKPAGMPLSVDAQLIEDWVFGGACGPGEGIGCRE